MEPISFDLTPLTRALKPAAQQPANGKPQAQAPRPPSAVARIGAYPDYLPQGQSWSASLAKEQLHALATHVLARNASGGTFRAVGVTSAMAEEGKTTVTLGLAERLAAARKRVLILDLDLHRGTLSREMGLMEAPGLREMESGEMERAPCYATDRDNIWVLPTGRNGTGESPVLEGSWLSRVFDMVRDEYDILLVDCPPMVPVAETHIVRDLVDGVVFVVRASATPRDVVSQALHDFGTDKLFAAVLNRVQPHQVPYFREVYGYYRRD